MTGELVDYEELRQKVGIDLSFYDGIDKDGATAGPAWLWHGSFEAPLRLADLPVPIADIIRRRGTAVPATARFGPDGPRHFHRPALLSAPNLVGRSAIAAVVLLAMSVALYLGGHGQMATVVGIGFLAAAGIVAGAAAVQTWDMSDPLRLGEGGIAAIARARRRMTWNPLDGDGEVSSGAALTLYAHAVITEIRATPAWESPALETHRLRVDLDEELFQIASASRNLDELEESASEMNGIARLAADQRDRLAAASELEASTFERVFALRAYLAELQLLGRGFHAGALADQASVDGVEQAGLASDEDNDAAVGILGELGGELRAIRRSFTP